MFRHALLEAPKSCQGDNNGQQANKPLSTGSRIMEQVMMSNHPSYIGTQQSNIRTPSPYPSPPPPPPPPPPPAFHYPQHPVSEFQPHTQLYEGSAVPHSALMHPGTLSHYPHPPAPPQFYNLQYRGVSQNLLTSKNAVDFILDLSRWGHVSKAWQEFQRTGLPRASSLPLMMQILHGCCGQNVRDPAKWSVAYCILEEISRIPQYDCTAQCMMLIKHLLQDGQTGDPATFHLMAMNVFNNLLPMKPNMTDMNMALINRMGRMLLEQNHIHPLCDLVMGIIKRKAFNCLPSPDIINGIKKSLQKEDDLNTLQTLVTALNESQNVQETSNMEIDFENNNSTVDPARKLMDSDSKKCPSEVFEASFSIQQCTMWKDTRDTLLDLCQRRPDVARAKPVIQELMKKLVEPADMAGSKFNNFVTVFSRHFKDVNVVRVLSRLGINCLAMCCSTHQWQQAFYILDCLSTNHFPYLQELGSDILVPHPKLKLFNWDISEVWIALVAQVCLEVREPKYATQLLADPNINVSIDEEEEGSHNPLFHLSCKKLEQLVRLCVDKSAFSQSLVPLKHLHKQNHYERYTSLFNQVLFAALDSRNEAYFSIYQEMQTERALTLEKRNYRFLISVLWNTGTDYKQQYARQLHTRGFNNGIYIKFKKDQKYHEACLLFDLTAGEVNLTMESFLTDAHTLEIVAKHKQRSTCTVKLSFINNDLVLAPNSAGPRNILRLVDSYLEELTPPIKWKNSTLRAASEDVYHQSYLLDLDSVGKWLEKQGM
ncbi:uncharacterized protein [Asterias amurensis]|uniref:uncharacterized protein isoform X1 n=1 Tax=Asterias amurensis TaxID=7602 RepID=UPI003AB8F21C